MYTLYHNAQVLTMDNAHHNADAVLVEGHTIAFVGRRNEINIPAETRFVDCRGKLLLPAFIDTHTHFFELSRRKLEIDVSTATSVSHMEEILAAFAAKLTTKPAWISGSGWNINIYPDAERLNKSVLDRYFPDTPVSLQSKDFHTILANSAALRAASVTARSKAPEGGSIGVDANGALTGFLYEKAWDLIESVKPPLPRQQSMQAIKDTVADCHALGLAGVHVMEDQHRFAMYTQLVHEGLDFTFCWHFPTDQLDAMISRGIRSYTGDERLKYGGMKIFMDGSVGSQSAFMFDQYPNGGYGNLIYQPHQLWQLIDKAGNCDIGTSIHAIGDACVDIVVSALEKAHKKYPKLFYRIEHLQSCRPADIPRLTAAGIFCAVQPVHIKADVYTTQKYWPQAQHYSYSFNSLLKAGVQLGFGSDAPVETIDPFAGIYAALQRKYDNNPDEPSWHPHERLSVWQALAGYTSGAATASQSLAVRGTVTPGKRADFILINDFRPHPNEFWLNQKVQMTVVGGNMVHRLW